MEQTLNALTDTGVLLGDKDTASSEVLVEEIVAIVSHIRAVHKDGSANHEPLVQCIVRFETQLNIEHKQLSRNSHVDEILECANVVWAAALKLLRHRDQRDLASITRYGIVLSELDSKSKVVTDAVFSSATEEALQEALFNLSSTTAWAKQQMELMPSEQTPAKSIVEEARELSTYVSAQSDLIQARRNKVKGILPSPTEKKDHTDMNTATKAPSRNTATSAAAFTVAQTPVKIAAPYKAAVKTVSYSDLLEFRKELTAADKDLQFNGSNTAMVTILGKMSTAMNLSAEGTMETISGNYSNYLNSLIANYAIGVRRVEPPVGTTLAEPEVQGDAGLFVHDMVGITAMYGHDVSAKIVAINALEEGRVDNGELHPSFAEQAAAIAAQASANMMGGENRRLIAITANGPVYEDIPMPVQLIEQPLVITKTTKVLGGVAVALGIAAVAGAGYGIYRLVNRDSSVSADVGGVDLS